MTTTPDGFELVNLTQYGEPRCLTHWIAATDGDDDWVQCALPAGHPQVPGDTGCLTFDPGHPQVPGDTGCLTFDPRPGPGVDVSSLVMLGRCVELLTEIRDHVMRRWT